jgi:hypothetical protein
MPSFFQIRTDMLVAAATKMAKHLMMMMPMVDLVTFHEAQ